MDGFDEDEAECEGADKERRFWAVFSQRSATRLKRLSLPISCSMRARAIQCPSEKNLGRFGSDDRRNHWTDAALAAAEAIAELSFFHRRPQPEALTSGPRSSRTSNSWCCRGRPPARWKASGVIHSDRP